MNTRRVCYVIGAALMAGGLVHLAVLVIGGGTWAGPVSFRKPMTFGLSFGLILITIAWVSSFLPLGPRLRRWSLGAFAAACVAEVALITVQAWRHVPSHFNLGTPFDSLVARVLAAGGAVLVAVIALLTVASWRSAPAVAPSMRLAVRAGLLALDVALAFGVVMIVIGVTDVARGDQAAAYAVGSRWKAVHEVPMYGIVLLPLLARLRLPERLRLRVVAVAVAVYAVLCAAALALSVQGSPR